MSCSPVCWILHSITDTFCGLPLYMCLKDMKRAAGRADCRAEPEPGTGTDQGAGKDLSPVADSWLALPRSAIATHCSAFWGNSGSSGGSAPLPCSVLGHSAAPASPQSVPCSASTTAPLFAQFTASATFPKIQFFFPSLRTLHLVQSFPCHTGSGTASIGFQK